jgi:hypothetical protein
VAFTQQWPRAGRLPSRLFLIPVAALALAMATFSFAHWRWNARIGLPPARLFFDGLPVAGSLRDAQKEGFTQCIDLITTLRCRRDGVALLRYGPFNAAVDLAGGDGRGGFRQLTLWHNRDQDGAIDIGRELQRQGWQSCLTSLHNWGDQHILRRKGSPVRVSIDLSYYGKRRIRIMPESQAPEPDCI